MRDRVDGIDKQGEMDGCVAVETCEHQRGGLCDHRAQRDSGTTVSA